MKVLVELLIARVAELETALTTINDMRYHNRGTVSEDNAWDAFQLANKQACEIYDIARAALTRPAKEQELAAIRSATALATASILTRTAKEPT